MNESNDYKKEFDSFRRKIEDKFDETTKEISSLTAIVTNGLRDRTVRIEQMVESQNKRVDTLLESINLAHRRIDSTVTKEEFRDELKELRKQRDERQEDVFNRWFRLGLTVLSVSLAAILGFLL